MLVCWFVGLLVCWFVGLLVCWFVGLLVCWFVGLLACWLVGLLVCWFVGLLACWFVGLLSCFSSSQKQSAPYVPNLPEIGLELDHARRAALKEGQIDLIKPCDFCFEAIGFPWFSSKNPLQKTCFVL